VSGVPTGEHSRPSDDLCVAKVSTKDSDQHHAQPLLRRRLVLCLRIRPIGATRQQRTRDPRPRATVQPVHPARAV